MSRIPSTAEAALNFTTPAAPERQSPAPPLQPAAAQSDLRLVIEEDETNGTYVYKTVDRLTGEVVAQIPREDVLRMRREQEYAAGAVIRARA